MILRAFPEDLSTDAVTAVMSIQGTLTPFPPEQQVTIAAECIVGVLRELRLPAQQNPTRRKQYDVLCGEVQVWLRREIETLHFEKSH